jgi:hypothetical protein
VSRLKGYLNDSWNRGYIIVMCDLIIRLYDVWERHLQRKIRIRKRADLKELIICDSHLEIICRKTVCRIYKASNS